MSFRDNLLHLRAAHNMTQEQLAVQLGVSRQSVTKWESERSYPEMDKLLKLCQLFDCTLDELVQGDLTGREPMSGASAAPGTPPADVFGYDEQMRRFANRISAGIMAIILGVAASVVMFSAGEPGAMSFDSLPENVAAMLGVLCVFVGVACGLALLLPAGLAHSQFVRAHPYLEDFYTVEQKAQARTVFSYELIFGIACVFVGICVMVFLGESPYEETVGIPMMLACVAVGVRFIVHGGMTLSRVDIAAYNRSAAEALEAEEIANAPIPPERKSEMLASRRVDQRIGAVCGIIMIVATIIALLMLFVPVAQGSDLDYVSGPIALFWLPWPIGGLCCGVAALLIKGFSGKE